jgi:hypothetical protein
MNSHFHLRSNKPGVGYYEGKMCAFGTMHGKDRMVAQVFDSALCLEVVVPAEVDTDQFGTFTGEIARLGSMEEIAIAKARMAMKQTGLKVGLGSEGSYGPHPHIPFIPVGLEMMVLVDDERGYIIREHIVDDRPVFGHRIAADISELAAFLIENKFPSHSVIVRPNVVSSGKASIHKGISNASQLAALVKECAYSSEDGKAFVQTDMRAHRNPTRMATIRRLAEKLAARISQNCPRCSSPGYGQIGIESGLACQSCSQPTDNVRYQVYGCSFCAHLEYRPRDDGRTHADPAQCQHCNP